MIALAQSVAGWTVDEGDRAAPPMNQAQPIEGDGVAQAEAKPPSTDHPDVQERLAGSDMRTAR